MRANTAKTRPAMRGTIDAGHIAACSHLLVMRAQLAGNFRFDGHAPSAEENFVASQCRSLCDSIVRSLPVCRENDIPELLECHDILCRLGHGRMPDRSLADRSRRRMFNAWKTGDSGIDESKVFGMVAPLMSNPSLNPDREYMNAYIRIKERWLSTLLAHSTFPGTTACENYQRLALMMHENIDNLVIGDPDKIKNGWYRRNRAADLSDIPTPVLRSYRRFAGSLFPAVIDFDTKLDLDDRILAELSTRTDLDPHDREAFRLALRFNTETATPVV